MLQKFILLLFLGFSTCTLAQTDTITIMSYNLLNFPDGRTDCGSSIEVVNRFDTLRKIIGYAKPDIFVACEIQNQKGADSILNRSLNVFGTTNYTAANFHVNNNGGNLQNMLYYNNDKLVLQSQGVILTSSRDIDHYVLYSLDPNLSSFFDTTFIEVYMCHLKAGSSSANQVQRNGQVDELRSYIETRPTSRNHFVCGDLNVYRSTEAAYQNLTSGGVNPMQDPINTPGNWNNSSSYANVHTQSTRTSSTFDCGSSGGSDDRFDQILVSSNVLSGNNNIRYLNGSYDALGNDGNHFNTNLLAAPVNVQYPDSVIKALYYMSDHLPVVLKSVVTFPTSNGLALNPSQSSVSCFGASDGTATVTVNAGQGPYTYLWDATTGSQTEQTANNLSSGLYCVTVTDFLGETDEVCVYVSEPTEILTNYFTTGSTAACDGTISFFISGGVSPYTYLWDDPLGQTTSNPVNLCPGFYTVIVTDSIGCQISASVNIATVGIEENDNDWFSVFPNPFKYTTSIISHHHFSKLSITITNVLGKIVHSQVAIGKKIALDLGKLSRGTYFIQINVDGQTLQKRIIKY